MEKYKEDTCCICLENFKENYTPLEPCGHYIHTSCVYKSGKDTCPICRIQIVLNDDEKKELTRIQQEIRIQNIEEEQREIINQLETEIEENPFSFIFDLNPVIIPPLYNSLPLVLNPINVINMITELDTMYREIPGYNNVLEYDEDEVYNDDNQNE